MSKRMSDEERRARLQQIMSNMDERWLMWIVDVAAKHYAGKVKDNLDELIRLEHPARPGVIVDPASLYSCSEQEQRERASEWYKQNQAILEFLMLLRDELRFLSTRKFAKDMADYFARGR